ncbi:MAG TPA: NTP transferase domain-containing protein [Epulopiscium sp.]|nr:NTP transferase domain-containing protein [Candidatus Epulonipiscium sp.]
MNVKSIILATDQGVNMKSNKATVLHSILGKSLISYTIDVLKSMEIKEISVVVGHHGQDIENVLGDGVDDVLQEASSVTETMTFIGDQGNVMILNGDAPLITKRALRSVLDIHHKANNGATVLSASQDNSEDYGAVYVFKTEVLQSALLQMSRNNQPELYIQGILDIIRKEGCAVEAIITTDICEMLRISSRVQLAQCASVMKERINDKHMANGVTLEDPSNTYIEPDVTIGYDTVIEPNCILRGTTIIGEDCFIGMGTNIDNSQVSNGVHIESSHIHESFIDDHAHIGPFAYIRPHSKIGKNVKIGDFVEIKNANIGDNTKVSHLTYVGDADVGKHVNFGCGTVLVNYDGVNKHRSIIEDNAFIGCNTNLVSPVKIGKRAFTAAGSTITNDVPEESLGISRVRQVNKEGWVAYKYPKK